MAADGPPERPDTPGVPEVRSTKYEVRSTAVEWESMATVGRVIRPHGNRGHVVVASETDFGDERFRVGSTLHMLSGDRIEPVVVSASREHQGRWVVGFEGVDSINVAETLRGRDLRVPGDALHELAADRFYVHDLIGCEVRTRDNAVVGTVERVDFNVGIPLLVVVGRVGADGADEVLVPFTDAICRSIDVAARTIEIDPPEGLIDLNRRKARG